MEKLIVPVHWHRRWPLVSAAIAHGEGKSAALTECLVSCHA